MMDHSIQIAKVRKDRIDFVRTLQKTESKCLSIGLSSDTKFAFAGYEDSSVRKWDLSTGECLFHFVKQTKKSVEVKGLCMIWSMEVFKDHTLICGDSTGEVSLIDANHGVLIQQFNQLKADVLCLAVNVSEGTVYASGTDSRILTLKIDLNDKHDA